MPCRTLCGVASTIALLAACSDPPNPDPPGAGMPGTPSTAPVPPPQTGSPDILLITLDTVRADRFGAYGDPLASTPNLDALSRQSALFRNAMTVAPITLPSHASMMTGRWPHQHGSRDNGMLLRDDLPTAAEHLSEAGYHTGAFVSAYVLDATWGLHRGFDTYFDDFHPEDVATAVSLDSVERPATETIDKARQWWSSTESPRLGWVHLFDAHAPYVPPSPGPGGDPYRGEIRTLDSALAPLLAEAEDAWVIVVGDHGESLWDEGEAHHGLVLNHSVIRVPLWVRPPGGIDAQDRPEARAPVPRPAAWTPPPSLAIPGLRLEPVPDAPFAARVVEEPVSVVDVAPTLLDLAGLPCPDCVGTSLRPLATGSGGGDGERILLAETRYPLRHYGWAPAMAAISGPHLAIRRPDLEWFDYRTDPWLQRPLDGPVPSALVDALAPYGEASSSDADLEPDVRAALEALGYLTTTADTDTLGPDVRERIGVLQRLSVANKEIEIAPARAEKSLASIVAEEPGLVDAWTSLGLVRLLRGDIAAALDAHQEAAALSPDSPLILQNVIVTQRAAGEHRAALALATTLAKRWPSDARWHRFRADLGGRIEQPAIVRDACRDGIVVAPEDPYLHYMLGLSLLQLDEPKQALAALDAATAAGTRARDVDMWRGQALQATGDIDGAVAAWRKQVMRTPDDLRPLVAAALLLADEERCAEAIPYLVDVIGRGIHSPELLAAADKCRPQTP